jgi:PadR family transcriptional regulator
MGGRGKHLGELEVMVMASLVRIGQGATGTEIYQELEARTGRDPTVPAVHVTLRRLESKGFADSRLGEPSPRGGRAQRHYRLTPRGLQRLEEARKVWEAVWRGFPTLDEEILS